MRSDTNFGFCSRLFYFIIYFLSYTYQNVEYVCKLYGEYYLLGYITV
jgi:hypothetical protein